MKQIPQNPVDTIVYPPIISKGSQLFWGRWTQQRTPTLIRTQHQTPCTDILIQGSCTAASSENLSRRSCARSSQRELAESNSVSILRTTLNNTMLSLLGSLLTCLLAATDDFGPFHLALWNPNCALSGVSLGGRICICI